MALREITGGGCGVGGSFGIEQQSRICSTTSGDGTERQAARLFCLIGPNESGSGFNPAVAGQGERELDVADLVQWRDGVKTNALTGGIHHDGAIIRLDTYVGEPL